MPTPIRSTAPTVAVLQALLSSSSTGWSGLDLGLSTGLRPGTLHPTLARLERLGCVDSAWQDSDPGDPARPRRRIYKLNPNGMELARRAIRDAQRAQDAWQPRWRPAAGTT